MFFLPSECLVLVVDQSRDAGGDKAGDVSRYHGADDHLTKVA